MTPASYPISAAAKLTGIPLDTLRAWERRYLARSYPADRSGSDLFRRTDQASNSLASSVEQGHSIGQIAGIKDGGLRDLLEAGTSLSTPERAKSANEGEIRAPVPQVIARYDYVAADREINQLAARWRAHADFVHEATLPHANYW